MTEYLQLIFPTTNDLIEYLDKSQYMKIIKPNISGPIMTRYDLQKITIDDGRPVSRSSGTLGMPVVVPKTKESIMWHQATNIRDLKWRKWDPSKKSVAILSRIKENKVSGNIYQHKLDSVSNLQTYLNEVQPHFLYTYPSIIDQLDLSLLTNLIDVRSVGEAKATCYSCEEAGVIALQCPDYPNVYHIMENIVVETDPKHGILITDLTNPAIKRYALGDSVELGTEKCKCGRELPTITKIYGRIRNMFTLPNGDKVWPIIGEPLFMTITNKIIQHQTIQLSLYDIVLRLKVREKLSKTEELSLLDLVAKTFQQNHFKYQIVYVDEFPPGKFEAFISMV